MAFNWKIWGKKLAINAGIVILAGLVVFWQEDPKYMALIPLAKAAENWLKHRKD